MNSPQGLMWTIVSGSKYCSGITRFTTFSITSLRKVSSVTFSECWSETTTVWTRFGMHAPWSNKYSHVTCWKLHTFDMIRAIWISSAIHYLYHLYHPTLALIEFKIVAFCDKLYRHTKYKGQLNVSTRFRSIKRFRQFRRGSSSAQKSIGEMFILRNIHSA